MIKRALITSLILSLVTAWAPAKSAPEKGAVFDFEKPPADQTDLFVAATRGGNLKKISRIAIVNFTVEFMTGKGVSAKTHDGAKSSTIFLPALDTEVAQGIADRLYDQLVADLGDMGLEVIPFETLKTSKNFAKLKGAQHETPWQLDNPNSSSVFIGARGMPIYVDNPERLEGLQHGLGASFGTNTRLHEVMLCNEFKGNLLSVNVVIDFADTKTPRFFTNVDTSYAHYLPAKHTRYRFAAVGQPDFAWLALSQRLESGNSPFVEVSSTEHKSVSIDETQTETSKVTGISFDEALYLKDSERMARAANALFMSAFARERGGPAPVSTGLPIK